MKSPIITASPMIAFAFASAAQGAVVPSSPLLTRNTNTQSISRRAAKAASVVETSNAYISYAPMRRSLDQAATTGSTDIYLSYEPENPGQVKSRGTNHSAHFKRRNADEESTSHQPPTNSTKRQHGLANQPFFDYEPSANSIRDLEFTRVELTDYQRGFADEQFTSYQTPTNLTKRGFTNEQFTSRHSSIDLTKRRSLVEHEFFNYRPSKEPSSREQATVNVAEAYMRDAEARKREEEFAMLEAEADAAEEHDIVDPDDKYLIGFLLHKLNR